MTKIEPIYVYDCELVRVIDGDTVVLCLHKDFSMEVDFGFHIKDEVHLHKTSVQTFRLTGIDTPEVVGATKAAGLTAKAALQKLLEGTKLRVTSHGMDKYGRWLGTILATLADGTNVNINDWLLSEGYAKIYIP